MRNATDIAGSAIAADANAPKTAICPYCKNRVTLRKRRLMDGSHIYYWRHQANRARHCPARSTGV